MQCETCGHELEQEWDDDGVKSVLIWTHRTLAEHLLCGTRESATV